MAKPQRKPNTPPAKTAIKQAALPNFAAIELPDFISNIRLQGFLLFAFAFLLYANTLSHDFVLDDDIVIKQNMFTQQGAAGIPGILSKDTFFGYFKVEGKENLVSGGRYRPFTLVLFALVFQFFGASPFMFHLLTVTLFAATCVVLYRTLLLMLSPRGGGYAALMSFLTAALFAAHPIHTEVVANIKGCDEIVTLLCSLGAVWCMFKAFDTGKSHWRLLTGLVFFVACLSKENAATFVVIAPLALWFFRPANGSQIVKYALPIWGAFLLFFIIRGTILQWKFGAAPMELMNNPFLKISGANWVAASAGEKMATILYTMGKYVLLLLFPHPLTHDYYPKHIPLMDFSSPLVLLSLALYGYITYYAINGIKHKDPIRFGILFYLLSLSIVSNFVFPIGTNMGERFAFMPSVGFCLIIASLLTSLWKGARGNNTLLILGVILAFFSLKTLLRNPAWATNEKLFFTDVAVSGNSAKIRNACGGFLFEQATKEKDPVQVKTLCEQALVHLNKAVEIYRNYKDSYMSRGGCHFLLKNYDAAIADYRAVLQISPEDTKGRDMLGVALREGGKVQGEVKRDAIGAVKMLLESWQINPKEAETARLLGVAHGVQNKHAEAITWFGRAVELAPENASYLFDLGTAYYLGGDAVKGAQYRQMAIQKDPKLGQNPGK